MRLSNFVLTAAVLTTTVALVSACEGVVDPSTTEDRPVVAALPALGPAPEGRFNRSGIPADSPDGAWLAEQESFIDVLDDLSMEGWNADWTSLRRVEADDDERAQFAVEVALTNETRDIVGWAGVAVDAAEQAIYVNLPGDNLDDSTFEEARLALTYQQGGCNPRSCDYAHRLTLYWACINLDNNPLGYAQRRWRRWGYSTCNQTPWGTTSNPAWYANWCGGLVACPGVQQGSQQYIRCTPTDGSIANYCL